MGSGRASHIKDFAFRYTEVAVIASHRLLSTFTLSALLVAPLIGSGGCADMVTFSKDSRQKGIQQYAEGNYQDAAGSFQNAIRQDPRDFRSHFYLAESYA